MVSTLPLVALVCIATLAEADGECGDGGKRAGTHCVCALTHTCRGSMCTYARSGKRTLRSGDDRTSTVVKARSGFSMSKCTDCSCVADHAKIPLPTPGPPGTYVPGSDGTYAQNYQVRETPTVGTNAQHSATQWRSTSSNRALRYPPAHSMLAHIT